MTPFYQALLRLFGERQAAYLTAVHDVEVQSWLPAWLAPFVFAGLAALAAVRYARQPHLGRRQKALLIVLRSAAYGALLFLLARPVFRLEGEGALPGTLPVVVDGSQSMGIADVEGRRRADRAIDVCAQLRAKPRYAGTMDLACFWGGAEFRPLAAGERPEADGGHTSINQLLEKGVERFLGEYSPGLLLIGDGAHNTREVPEQAWAMLKKRRIPVYAMGTGQERSRDLAIAYVLGEDVVFVDEKSQLFVQLRQSGYPLRPFTLSVYLGEERVYRGEHALERGEELTLPVEYVPRARGAFPLRVEIETLPGEITAENNRYVRNVRVIDEKIRILAVFGEPSWEYRFLLGAFERDKRVEAVSLLPTLDRRLRERLAAAGGRKFVFELPRTVRELHERYDIVLLSRIDVRDLPREFVAALAGFVKDEAGSLAVLCDPARIPYTMRGTPLEPLLPVALDDARGVSYQDELVNPLKRPLRFEVTEDGRVSPLATFSTDRQENKRTWDEFPPVYFAYAGGRVKPSALVLATLGGEGGAKRVPAIAHHSYGRGTVLYHAFDSTWRWRKEAGDRYFRDYWGKAVQFLGLPHLLNEAAQSTLFVANPNVQAGEVVAVRAKINNPDFTPYAGDAVPLAVEGEGGGPALSLTPVPERPGVYKTEFVPERPGTFQLRLPERFAGKPLEIQVAAQNREFRNSGLNRPLLEAMAAATGGRCFDERTDPAEMLRAIFENRPGAEMLLSISLWDTWAAAAVALALFGLEWLFRKLYSLD